MSPKLFGLDIASIVDRGLAAAGGVMAGTLIRPTPSVRVADALTEGRQTSDATYACRGFIEIREPRMAGTLVRRSGDSATILGASLPSGIEPQAGDRVSFGERTYEILGVTTRDPAAAAYICKIQA